MKLIWWALPVIVLLLLAGVTLRWPVINDVRTGQTPEYPDIRPLHLPDRPDAVFADALAVARASGWEIIEADAAAGRIEAVAVTRLLRFRDDVTVRVEPTVRGGTRVDMHSRSRIGRSDLGTNARRIRAFQDELLRRREE